MKCLMTPINAAEGGVKLDRAVAELSEASTAKPGERVAAGRCIVWCAHETQDSSSRHWAGGTVDRQGFRIGAVDEEGEGAMEGATIGAQSCSGGGMRSLLVSIPTGMMTLLSLRHAGHRKGAPCLHPAAAPPEPDRPYLVVRYVSRQPMCMECVQGCRCRPSEWHQSKVMCGWPPGGPEEEEEVGGERRESAPPYSPAPKEAGTNGADVLRLMLGMARSELDAGAAGEAAGPAAGEALGDDAATAAAVATADSLLSAAAAAGVTVIAGARECVSCSTGAGVA